MGASLIAVDKLGVVIQFGTGMGDEWFARYEAMANRKRALRAHVRPATRTRGPRSGLPCVRRWCTFDRKHLQRFRELQGGGSCRWIDWKLLDAHDWVRIEVWW